MGSGVSRTHRGSFIGTGAAKDIDVGTKVRSVKLFNTNTAAELEWFEPMPEGSAKKTVAAGTQSFITTQGITPLAKTGTGGSFLGFTVGNDAVNGAGNLIVWEATE